MSFKRSLGRRLLGENGRSFFCFFFFFFLFVLVFVFFEVFFFFFFDFFFDDGGDALSPGFSFVFFFSTMMRCHDFFLFFSLSLSLFFSFSLLFPSSIPSSFLTPSPQNIFFSLFLSLSLSPPLLFCSLSLSFSPPSLRAKKWAIKSRDTTSTKKKKVMYEKSI